MQHLCPLRYLAQALCPLLTKNLESQHDLKELDEALHRSLAVSLPSMQEPEMRDALAGITFAVPSRRQQAVTTARAPSTAPDAVIPPGSSRHEIHETAMWCGGSEDGFESPLRPGGAEQAVTPGGFEEYRELVVQKRLVSDCAAQMELVRTGERSVSGVVNEHGTRGACLSVSKPNACRSLRARAGGTAVAPVLRRSSTCNPW